MMTTPLADAILVVDDDTDSREMLGEYLEAKGFTVHAAPDGVMAIALAEAHRPRVILMDLAMPGLDGLEATRRLRANARTRAATIVMVTAHVFRDDRKAAYRAGCDFFVPKPYDIAALATFVSGLMSVRTQGRGASSVELRAGSPSWTIAGPRRTARQRHAARSIEYLRQCVRGRLGNSTVSTVSA